MGKSCISVLTKSSGTQEFDADYVEVDERGGLEVVSGAMPNAKSVAGFAPGEWLGWKLLEGDKDDGD